MEKGADSNGNTIIHHADETNNNGSYDHSLPIQDNNNHNTRKNNIIITHHTETYNTNNNHNTTTTKNNNNITKNNHIHNNTHNNNHQNNNTDYNKHKNNNKNNNSNNNNMNKNNINHNNQGKVDTGEPHIMSHHTNQDSKDTQQSTHDSTSGMMDNARNPTIASNGDEEQLTDRVKEERTKNNIQSAPRRSYSHIIHNYHERQEYTKKRNILARNFKKNNI